jgi:methylglyoxal synthase
VTVVSLKALVAGQHVPEIIWLPRSLQHLVCGLRECSLLVRSRKEAMFMVHRKIAMEHNKKIALVAHDNKKRDLVEWAEFNRELLARHKMYATGTTGELLEQELGFKVTKLQSGPLGGDQQIGAKIADGEIDFLIFFSDPLEPQPHDPDVKALLRMALVWNIPVACNRSSADFMISSPLMDGDYDRLVPDYDFYRSRRITRDEP